MKVRTALYGTIGLLALGAATFVVTTMRPADQRGLWETIGYGRILDVGRFWIDSYEITPVSCRSAQQLPAQAPLLALLGVRRIGLERDTLGLILDGTLEPIMARRIERLPDLCQGPPDDSASAVFDVMWAAMDHHYPFFDLRGIDWAARRALRPADDATLDDDALWAVLTSALTGLDDAHVTLSDGADRRFSSAIRPAWHDERRAFRDVTQAAAGPLEQVPGTDILWRLTDGVAYLQIGGMQTEPGWFTTGAAAATSAVAALDAAGLGTARAIIVDLRYNPGGSDDVALAYADPFHDTAGLAFEKITWDDDGGLGRFPVALPDAGPNWPQPTILLTGPNTTSAAEVFAMVLQGQPQVTLMGEPTAGALSDMLEFTLPNGWLLTLSHQIYRRPDGTSPEGAGLIPDLLRPVDLDGLRAGADSLLAEAMAIAASRP